MVSSRQGRGGRGDGRLLVALQGPQDSCDALSLAVSTVMFEQIVRDVSDADAALGRWLERGEGHEAALVADGAVSAKNFRS